MSRYGEAPKQCGKFVCEAHEMMFYQDMPIKMPGEYRVATEPRLSIFDKLCGAAAGLFIGEYGLDRYMSGHAYISAKRLFQTRECTFNRQGWHSDGFGSDDINFIWYDKTPTVFNLSEFDLPNDDVESMAAMNAQALQHNDVTYESGTLLRLNQFCIHRLALPEAPEIRTFVKVTFSKDKFDLEGNAKNYTLHYDWPMRKRGLARNIPQQTNHAGLWDQP